MTRARIGMNRILFVLAVVAAATLAAAGPGPAQAPGGPAALEQAIAWMQEAQRNYRAAVRDYTCIFVSRENIKGRMNEDQIMQFKSRTQPFSIYMKWLS